MSAIFKLANETLVEVMWLLVLESAYCPPYRKHSRQTWGFLPMTHICRHWRLTAISTPKPWSFIHISNENETLLCFSRCGSSISTPLRVIGAIDRIPKVLSILRNTKNFVQRLETLELFISSASDATMMLELLPSIISPPRSSDHPTPSRLRELTLHVNSRVSDDSWDTYPEFLRSVSYRDRPFEPMKIDVGTDSTPNLTSLSLHGRIYPTLSPDHWTNIKTFHLTFSAPLRELNVHTFLSAFGLHNNLEELSLRKANFISSSDETANISLHALALDSYFPALRRLSLESCCDVHSFLLAVGPCTQMEQLSIKSTVHDEPSTPSDQSLRVIPRSFLQQLPFSRQNIPVTMEIAVVSRFFRLSLEDLSSTRTYLTFEVSIPQDQVPLLEEAIQLFGHLYVQRFRQCDGCADKLDKKGQAYRAFFSTFSRIESLSFPHGYTYILDILSQDSRYFDTYLCPDLQQIEVLVRNQHEFAVVHACLSARSTFTAAKRAGFFCDSPARCLKKLKIYSPFDTSSKALDWNCLRPFVATLEINDSRLYNMSTDPWL